MRSGPLLLLLPTPMSLAVSRAPNSTLSEWWFSTCRTRCGTTEDSGVVNERADQCRLDMWLALKVERPGSAVEVAGGLWSLACAWKLSRG
jgi:hypothetical protein